MGSIKINRNIPQEKAIETINTNVVVNAGAGTGKTRVLTSRYLYILENGELPKNQEIESIVAITFTKKATQEMIERIREEIKSRLGEKPEWIRYYRDFEKANISTIHGFCSKLLKENPIEANIDPYFQILDENQSRRLLSNSCEGVLYNRLEKDERFIDYMNELQKDNINLISGELIGVYNKIRTSGNTFEEVRLKTRSHRESLSLNMEDVEKIKELLNFLISKLSKRTRIGKLEDDPMWLEFNDGYNEDNVYEYIEYFSKCQGTSKVEREAQDELKIYINRVLMSKHTQDFHIYEMTMDILEEIDDRYTSLKRREGVLDYNDLELLTAKLLDHDEIRSKYQDKYKYYMIDEFQDTNELQKSIFYKLTSVENKLDQENLFVVGDPKQSIYGFRGTDISVFYDVIDDIRGYGEENIITLDTNYRSVNTIMNFVNNIFTDVMGNKYDKLSSNNESKNNIDVEILYSEDIEHVDGIDSSEIVSVYEADLIAKRIRQLVDKEGKEYKDIALLFRTTSRNYIYEEILDSYGIPYFNSGSKTYYEKQEVKDLISIIKFLSNPFDIISGIGYLKSPMVGLNDESLYKVLNRRSKNIYLSLLDFDSDLPVYEKEKFDFGIDNLKYLYSIKDYFEVEELIHIILDRTDYINSLLLREDGKQAIANVYKFIDISKKHYAEEKASLEDFIEYIEEARQTSESEEVIESENSNVVKIQTIHGSKGLQYPVVFLPEMSRLSGGGDGYINFDKNLGIGIKDKNGKSLFDRIADIDKIREKEEEERLLYVAMTRAEELLILGYFGKDSGFKKILKDRIDETKIKLISKIDYEKNKEKKMEIISTKNIVDDEKEINLDLIYDVESYGKKNIERFTLSQFMLFKECQRKYFLEYIWKLDIDSDIDGSEFITDDEQVVEGVERGNIVHDFCSSYRIGMDVERVIESSIEKNNFEVTEGIKNQVRPYIDKYLESYVEEYDEIISEKPFYYPLEEGYLHGYIDRINIKNGRIDIIDYKTNRIIDMENLIDYYGPQIKGYAYIAERIYNMPVNKGSLLFLESGELKDIDISKESLDKNMKEIVEFTKYVNKYQSIDDYVKSDDTCSYCNYNQFCKKI